MSNWIPNSLCSCVYIWLSLELISGKKDCIKNVIFYKESNCVAVKKEAFRRLSTRWVTWLNPVIFAKPVICNLSPQRLRRAEEAIWQALLPHSERRMCQIKLNYTIVAVSCIVLSFNMCLYFIFNPSSYVYPFLKLHTTTKPLKSF